MAGAEPAQRLHQSASDGGRAARHPATHQRRHQRQHHVALWIATLSASISPDTINTVTVETLDAYRSHGEPKARLEQNVEQAGWVLQRLPELGINLDQVTQQLEDEGVERFNQSFDKLMNALIKKSTERQGAPS